MKNCGVIIDCELNSSKHIKSAIKSAFYLRSLMSKSDLEILIQVFLSSRLDYCSCLFMGPPKEIPHKLQMMLNAAASLDFVVIAFCFSFFLNCLIF